MTGRSKTGQRPIRSSYLRLLVVGLAGCTLGADAGMLQRPPFTPRGGSIGGHTGMDADPLLPGDFLLAIDLDTRVDVARGGSRWTAGASALGGVKLGGLFATGRVGVWRAIVSGSKEASVVPSFEIGGFVPLRNRFDPAHPARGSSIEGMMFGVREDIDDASYFTVFVGYALFSSPGY